MVKTVLCRCLESRDMSILSSQDLSHQLISAVPASPMYASAGFHFDFQGIIHTFDNDLSWTNDDQNENTALEAGIRLRNDD
jgi:hypothetical protein